VSQTVVKNHIVPKTFAQGFALALMTKDVRLANALGEQQNLCLPLLEKPAKNWELRSTRFHMAPIFPPISNLLRLTGELKMSVSPNYPDTVHFQGLNRPTHIEGTAHDLYVEGEIPAEIDGIFFRAVPDPAYVPTRTDDVILSADGAINKIEFRGGRVSYGLKYVRTHRFLAEQRAGGIVWPLSQPVHG
jgi:hypothetical protein